MWCLPQIGTFFGLLIFFAPIENTKRKKYWSQCSSSCLHRTTRYILKVQQYYANLVNWIFPDYLLFLKGGSALERNKINRQCSRSWKKCILREVTKWLMNGFVKYFKSAGLSTILLQIDFIFFLKHFTFAK